MAMDDWTQSPVKRSYSRYEDERDDRGSRDERDRSRDDRDDRDGSSRHKRRRASEPSDPPTSSPSDIEFRILCPVAKIGSVIGKGGSIIKTLRQDSRAKIKVEDVVHGADERIIYITSSPGKDHDRRERDDREEMLCPAQDALFRIFSRITEKEDSDNVSPDEEEDEPASHVTVRLLVSDGQVGCLIGKGGRIIEQMRKDIAAQIRVLPKASLPPCAFPNDELVQLSGTPALVREALYAVSTKLYENPVRERAHRPSGLSHGTSFPGGGMHSSFHAPGSMYGMGHYGGRTNSFPVRSSRSDGPLEEEFMICVLCPNDKIGSVIGKGGSVIRKLREESGAKIRVCDQVGDSDERVIQISALEYIDSYASPTLEAVMQVFRRLAEISADRDGRHAIFSIRLLVRANQIGCLLGKGGQIITEMRKTSRANIRIPPKEELPSCADENSELVQVSGESAMVEAALIQVLTRLRTNLFSGRGGAGHGNSGSQHGSGPTYSTRDNRDEPGSPGGYSYEYGHYNTSPGATRSSRDSRRRQR